MVSVKPDTTLKEYQNFTKEVYGLSNDRYFNTQDLLSNVERFTMRALKGIRKGDKEKTKLNLLIALSWFMSMMNQFHIDIENKVWERFPHTCSYCASCPCVCEKEKVQTRRKTFPDEKKRPQTLKDFQEMFYKIYPPQNRTLEQAGIHLVEEIGEFSEAILTYRGQHKDEDFSNVVFEAADLFSCFASVFNSLETDITKELSGMFSENCHVCKKAPCVCTFVDITGFKS